MPKLVDRVGDVYGRLRVIRRDLSVGPASKGTRTKWICVCSCGRSISVTGHGLASGDTTSCGCLHREAIGHVNRSHGMARTPTYRSWQAAKDRCYNPRNERYPAYGALGVTMADEWRQSFETFLLDMGERPPLMTLDRIDPMLGYSPENCRWATDTTQHQNRRTNVIWAGQSRTIKSIAEEIGVPRTSLSRLFREIGDIKQAALEAAARMRQ